MPLPALSDRHGVALVLVLGLLTIMIILATAFAISMRTERIAASNYLEAQKAQQWVYVGLVRAMDQLRQELPPGVPYPTWTVTNAYGSGYADGATNFLRGEATNFVPLALWQAASAAQSLNPTNNWIEITGDETTIVSTNIYLDTTNVVTTTNTLTSGRVGYMILNCSGLLDVNYVGGATRAYGINPLEIAISNLEEFVYYDAPVDDCFLAYREDDIRYDTLPELKALQQGNFTELGPSNFFIYSRCLSGYWDPAITSVAPQVNLADDLSGSFAAISNAIFSAGFTNAGEADIFFNNLLNYVDSDSLPRSPEPSVESVPMINEIVFSNTLSIVTVNGTNYYYMTNNVIFELWYPFVKTNSESFKLNVNIVFGSTPSSFTPPAINDPPVVFSVAPGSFTNIRFRSPWLVVTNYAGGGISCVASVTVAQVQLASGPTVDNLSRPAAATNYNINSNGSWSVRYLECLDPRFNWDPTSTSQWRFAGSATLGTTNDWTLSYLNPAINDGDAFMYVADGPLRSVAELGYLVYSTNAPWKTVKLYGPDRHKVLDLFAMGTNSATFCDTNAVGRGYVNPNTWVEGTLAAVFASMPVDEYPGGPVATNLSMADSRLIASRIIAARRTSGVFTNLSELGRALTNFSGLADNELKRESFFRNACGLLNLRQNVFTIIIDASPVSKDVVAQNAARQRAVAVVWRDPFTGEFFVRSLHWLGD